ncbi:TIGR04104 family putative zinc finger protein [Alkalicoccus saliphilus]|uniref:Cxxc_20_cxxc protein n=1 Tax=Alkalicoccus saliphilus TaxID=200989 RepID=A0A2T4U7F0_9BACI|nr:TIGR04104 family putative zinc finger protein [Alkalicoccus saliphilus]PTL39285.1 hypothetical protein C6Y45_06640 [Alkalicoccus saliphilus]
MKKPAVCPGCGRKFKYRELLTVNRSKKCPGCSKALYQTPAARKKQSAVLLLVIAVLLIVRTLFDLGDGLYLLTSTLSLIILFFGVPFLVEFDQKDRPMFGS